MDGSLGEHPEFIRMVAKLAAEAEVGERNASDEITLISALLGLGPLHSPSQAVKVLFEQGREEFERIRDLGVLAKSTENV